jgi:hypothetical protein
VVSLHQQLQQLTEKLLEYNHRMLNIAEQTHHSSDEPDFFGTVKPFADEVKQVIDTWKTIALQWIHHEKPKHIYRLQIEAVSENIEKLSVEIFYPTVKLYRIKQLYQSIEYTLTLIIERLQEMAPQNK